MQQGSATISNIRLNELGYLTADADNKKETSYQYLQDGIETMDALLAAYGDMIDEEERSFYDNANNLWTQYQDSCYVSLFSLRNFLKLSCGDRKSGGFRKPPLSKN